MGITMIATGAFRETGTSFFFIPKGALTHHLRSRRWYPSFVGPCALRGGCGSCGSLQTMPHHLRVLLSLPAVLKVGWVKMAHPTSAPCVNLPPAAFSQLWTELAVRPFSFSEKKQKQGYAKVRTIRSALCKELHKGYELNSHPLNVKRM